MGLLENKVILITGASRGIGKAIAEECVLQGGTVVFTYLSSNEKARDLENELSNEEKIKMLKRSLKITEEQMVDFAYKAVSLRSKATVNIMDVLEATRNEDKGSDLWSVFNVVQEKLIEGDFQYRAGGKVRQARVIKNFKQDIKMNQGLFEKALEYVV